MQETRVWSLAREDPLEKEIATHSTILAWKTPWTEEPGRLQSMGSQSRTQLHFSQGLRSHKPPSADKPLQPPPPKKKKTPYSIYCGWPFLQDFTKHPTTNTKWPRSDVTSFPSFVTPYGNSNLFRKSHMVHSWSVPTFSCRQKSETPALTFSNPRIQNEVQSIIKGIKYFDKSLYQWETLKLKGGCTWKESRFIITEMT